DRFPVLDLGSQLDAAGGAFLDTAAVMQSLDLVITSDTAIAHLAGGLGVPVWVALSYAPDWRWLLGRGDSSWDPSMGLFRQQEWGNWPQVFTRMAEEVKKLLGHAASPPPSQVAGAAGELLGPPGGRQCPREGTVRVRPADG